MQTNKASYQTKSPVLFLIFNRPDTTKLVFEAIKIAQPKRLYVAADAPRANHIEDELLCKQAREVIADIDWECEVKTLYRDNNMGCRDGVSSAISWFFEQEEEGIILEDDCLPSNSFFKFCDELLEKYRYDTRIRHITGCNLQQGKKWGEASYYFSNRTHVWGWASWKRVWDDYDKNLTQYSAHELDEKFLNIYQNNLVVESWKQIFIELKAGKINSWAYPLDFVNFFNNGLVIIPNDNLISNIGFGLRATNTLSKESIYSNIPVSEIDEITHPKFILPEKQADLFIMYNDFNIEERVRKQKALKYKIRKWLKSGPK